MVVCCRTGSMRCWRARSVRSTQKASSAFAPLPLLDTVCAPQKEKCIRNAVMLQAVPCMHAARSCTLYEQRVPHDGTLLLAMF